MFAWVRTTPLGTPVEPLVYMMMAVSSGSGGADTAVDLLNNYQVHMGKKLPN